MDYELPTISMQNKLSVVILRGKNISEMSDINKMSVHLEQILAEKDRVDLKIRQSITDALLKSANFIILCGYDYGLLSELFKILSHMETLEDKTNLPFVFLHEEPGQSVHSGLNSLITTGGDIGRMDIKIFNQVIDTWTYNDIIGYIDVALRRLGPSTDTQPTQPESV